MFAALLGPALSFGSSLISGLGARQSAKKQQKLQAAYEYQNFMLQQARNEQNAAQGRQIVAMYDPATRAVGDAMKAGFNPVTWLGAMGGMYSAMTQHGWNLQVGQDYFQNAPTAQVPSTMEAFGGALTAGVNTFLSDRRVAQSQDFQREMLNTQISAIQRNGGRPTSAMGVPASQRTFFGSGQLPYAVTAGPIGSAKSTGELGFSVPEPGKAEVTSPWGYGTRVNPNVMDAGAYTQRYGEAEVAEMGIWGYNTAQDLSWRYFGRTIGGAASQGWRTIFGYPVLNDGARGVTWGKPDTSYNPGELPGFGYSTGGRF